jgi:hypothetical protein
MPKRDGKRYDNHAGESEIEVHGVFILVLLKVGPFCRGRVKRKNSAS